MKRAMPVIIVWFASLLFGFTLNCVLKETKVPEKAVPSITLQQSGNQIKSIYANSDNAQLLPLRTKSIHIKDPMNFCTPRGIVSPKLLSELGVPYESIGECQAAMRQQWEAVREKYCMRVSWKEGRSFVPASTRAELLTASSSLCPKLVNIVGLNPSRLLGALWEDALSKTFHLSRELCFVSGDDVPKLSYDHTVHPFFLLERTAKTDGRFVKSFLAPENLESTIYAGLTLPSEIIISDSDLGLPKDYQF